MFDCTSGAVYAWLLRDEEICGKRVATDFEKFFIALASIGIARLNDKPLPSVQEIVKFVGVDDKAFDFWQEMAY